MLDYRYKTFLTLAETLSYTKTAEMMNVSQPAVTQQMQQLQEELHVPLLEYHNRKLLLTEAGQYLYDELKLLLPQINKIEDRLTGNSQQIRLGCGKTLGEFNLFNEEFSLASVVNNNDLSLSIDTTYYLLNKLNNNELDIAIVAGIFDSTNYYTIPYMKEKLHGIYSGDNSKLANAHQLSDLTSEILFIREAGSGVYDILEHALKQEKISYNDFKQTNQIANINAIKNLVSQKKGISFLFESSIAEELTDGRLKTIPLEMNLDVYFHIVVKKENKHHPKIQSIIQQLAVGR